MKKLNVILLILLLFISDGKNIYAEKSPAGMTTGRKIALENKNSILPKSVLLDVPLINQMDSPRLYNGCEVTSLAMLLNFAGVHVSKNELASRVNKVPLDYGNHLKGNPNIGFVGDMENGPGLSVFNGPIYTLAKEYAGDKAVNLSGSPFTDLLRMAAQGNPVWVITTVSFTPVSSFQVWETPQGKIKITLEGHIVVITGFDNRYIYVNDPYGVKNRKVERTAFIKAWEQMGSQAIAIEK